jgi:hypothetical protein
MQEAGPSPRARETEGRWTDSAPLVCSEAFRSGETPFHEPFFSSLLDPAPAGRQGLLDLALVSGTAARRATGLGAEADRALGPRAARDGSVEPRVVPDVAPDQRLPIPLD